MSNKTRWKSNLDAARFDLKQHIQPRDDFERAVIDSLGDIAWDEAVRAIEKHRLTQTSAHHE